jgi:hypothetical protein
MVDDLKRAKLELAQAQMGLEEAQQGLKEQRKAAEQAVQRATAADAECRRLRDTNRRLVALLEGHSEPLWVAPPAPAAGQAAAPTPAPARRRQRQRLLPARQLRLRAAPLTAPAPPAPPPQPARRRRHHRGGRRARGLLGSGLWRAGPAAGGPHRARVRLPGRSAARAARRQRARARPGLAKVRHQWGKQDAHRGAA